MEKRFQVFVSSTYVDLKEERQKVIQTLMEMDCIPAGMELFPAADEEQWRFIQRIIDDCDYYILIIGNRYGTITEEGISYTEKEYDYAISKGLNVLAFLHEKPDDMPANKSDLDSEARKKLAMFREKVTDNRLVKTWKDASELPGLVALSLTKTMKVDPAVGWVRASNVVSGELLTDMNELRKENVHLKTAIAALEKAGGSQDYNLAAIDEVFRFRLRWKEKLYNQNRERVKEVNATWNEIFAQVAPDLESHPSDGAVNYKLGGSFYRKDKPNVQQTVRIDEDDFKTIRVQLTAYGWIETRYSKTTKGDMALFWVLTEKGRRMMFEVRTIKTARGEI